MAEWGSFRESWFEGRPGDWGLHTFRSFETDHLRHGLAGTAGNVGNMLAEQLATTRTNHGAVLAFREHARPQRQGVDAHPRIRAQRALMAALYGTHPYAHESTGDEMGSVSWQEAQGWLEDVYRPANTVVVIAGEFDVKEVELLARKYLGDWSRGGSQPVAEPPEPPLPAASPRLKTFITPRPGATQGQVDVACRLPGATPEADARYSLMAELMQVDAWSRMRSERGASYGFHAETWVGRGGAAHLRVSGMVETG